MIYISRNRLHLSQAWTFNLDGSPGSRVIDNPEWTTRNLRRVPVFADLTSNNHGEGFPGGGSTGHTSNCPLELELVRDVLLCVPSIKSLASVLHETSSRSSEEIPGSLSA
ncbi:peptidase S41 [Anopheles sinensis]|uniref:Peptidase S41 n=1 Tax=Anopheles sinensis TaxID=74873 RepID=A0A084VMJ3_ANOSI|nr:peptidase S41 [Anopheles sinensis]